MRFRDLLCSCSLACSQSHKRYCAPKSPKPFNDLRFPTSVESRAQNGKIEASSSNGLKPEASGSDDLLHPFLGAQKGTLDFTRFESSPELNALWIRFPLLRSQLRDIYEITLESEWVEMKTPSYGRHRERGRGGGGNTSKGGRSRGPWTAEKGFNRGVGRVRKWRENPKSGEGHMVDEGFRQFAALVLAECESQEGEKQQ